MSPIAIHLRAERLRRAEDALAAGYERLALYFVEKLVTEAVDALFSEMLERVRRTPTTDADLLAWLIDHPRRIELNLIEDVSSAMLKAGASIDQISTARTSTADVFKRRFEELFASGYSA